MGSGRQWRQSPESSIDAALNAMGAADGPPRPPFHPMAFLRPGAESSLDSIGIEGPAQLVTEDGGEVRVEHRLPPDLPLGYHRLHPLGGATAVTLVVTPGVCLLPPHPMWGWAVQLYALRSRTSWGMGDLGDLAELARWSRAQLGAGMVVVNPLHASVPGVPQTTSPYYPSSRRFRNPLYLRVQDVPGAAEVLGPELEVLAGHGRSLSNLANTNGTRRIDRDAVFRLKLDALARIWSGVRAGVGLGGFDSWCARQGESLELFASFCVIVDTLGRSWRDWPLDCRHPGRAGIAALVRDRRDHVRFHMWLQWLIETQLEAASGDVAVIHDLAVGVDPDGADAWLWQDAFAPAMSVGAPPDQFNTQGQDWGVPPFDPWKLRDAGYQPFIETVRANLAHAGGLRVDHVMGLFRLYWIPGGASPKDGVYVRYPESDLLDILALESHRAGAFIVGEDLGTVESGVRDELAARQILSSRVVWSERTGPATFPVRAMASMTTHDLPTVAGLWTGSDLQNQRDAGTHPNEEVAAGLRERMRDTLNLAGDEAAGEVVDRAYRELGEAPSLLLAASLDDAMVVAERPNMPGTTDSWPNWSIPLPVSLEDIEADPRPARIAASLMRLRPDSQEEQP